MSPRWRVWMIAALAAAVLIAAIYFPFLRRRVKEEQAPQPTEEQVRQELTQPAEQAASPRVNATLFWAADENDSGLAPVKVQLPLSSDPVMRAKQVLNTLVAGPVDTNLRTLPPDAVLLAFYLLPNGTGIADFSEALATSTPSGIQSEQLAVDSIARTLEANVPQVKRLRILIHGQEVETLAGHVDLMQTFVVDRSAVAPAASPAQAPSPVAKPGIQPAQSAPPATPTPHP